MECEICQRAHHPKRLPFLCVVDARNELYEGRVANVKILMEREKIESQVNQLLAAGDASSRPPPANTASRVYLENCASEEQMARDRTERTVEITGVIRDDLARVRREMEKKRADIARRKSELATISQGLAARRNRELEEVKRAAKMTKYTWDREYDTMVQYKAALCMEVAKLYRLQRVRRGNPVRFEYRIGGIDIVDLHNINTVRPEQLSASLSHITHLLVLASHYLAIRLPAEITLPHNDYPRPTIFSLGSSYQHGEVSFPGSSPIPPDSRDRQFDNIPFPRPLFIDRPLSILAKEDPATYNSFLEGVSLLAYDIVWLCRTQGVPVGENSSNFDAFAGMGRNLYNLLINSSLQRNPQQIADDIGNHIAASEGSQATELGKAAPRMGLYSHGSAHDFLGSATGNDLTRNFKLPNPMKLTDKLKSKLVEGTTIPEWEILEDDAWTPEDGDDGVLVGGARPKPKISGRGAHFGFESYMSVATVRHTSSEFRSPAVGTAAGGGGPGERDRIGVKDRDRDRDKEKSTSGWTKVKPR